MTALIDRPTVVRDEYGHDFTKVPVVIPQSVREAMGLKSGEKAQVISFRNRIEIIPLRDVRKLRGYLKGIDSSFAREGDRA